MFSLYGLTGRVFKGTLEQLRREGPVAATARTQAVRGLALDADPRQVPGSPGAARQPRRGAVAAAYTQTGDISSERRPLSRVHELMTRTVITIAQDATLGQAAALLTSHGIKQLPVLDDQGRLVGLLLRTDLPQPWPGVEAQAALQLAQHRVQERMWTPVPSTDADTDIRVVAALLLDTGLPGLPVVDEQGVLAGVIARSDILRALVAEPPLEVWA